MAPNTEMFIGTVRKYPALYDTSHCDYKNSAVKNKIWNDIAKMLGECDGDILKKQWKNLRDAYSKHLRSCKARPGEPTKLIDRYKCWPWASAMSFLRPHLEISDAYIERHSEKTASSQPTNTSTPMKTETQPMEVNLQTQQDFKHVRRRKRTKQSQPNVDRVINCRRRNIEKDDDTDLLFKSYAKKLKKMTSRRQAEVKFEFAKIMLKAELAEADEMQPRLGSEHYQDNDMVMIIQPPASSADSDTND